MLRPTIDIAITRHWLIFLTRIAGTIGVGWCNVYVEERDGKKFDTRCLDRAMLRFTLNSTKAKAALGGMEKRRVRWANT